MIKRPLVKALALGLGMMAGSAMADDLMDRANSMFEPIPKYPPVIDGNELTQAKVELGKMLFFEPRLSSSHLISCNTCHNVGLGGDDELPTSIGHGWQKGPRNSPTVFNAVFNAAQFWDGRAADLAEQAKGPVQAGVEMSSTPDRVVSTLNSMPEYIERFEDAFPGQDNPVTFDNMAVAIEAYEATLITPEAPFDKYLRGDSAALNEKEKEGLGEFNRSTQIYFVASPQVSGSRVFSSVVHSASVQIHLTASGNSPINRSSSGSTGVTDDWCSRCCLFARGSSGHRNKPACRSQA